MNSLSINHMRAVLCANAGFALWVIADTCMKLAGEAELPAYEVVGFLGLFASLTIAGVMAPMGKLKALVPAHPAKHILRGFLAFGCVMANAVALKHLPLTSFYIVVFSSPLMIVVLASIFLHEHLTLPKIIAIIAGFVGVIIAIDPWNHIGGGDLVGYCAAGASAVFYALATVLLRNMSHTNTPESLIFSTAVVEFALGVGCMLWNFVPVSHTVLLILMLMGMVNAAGNFANSYALRYATAATVEQFHYSQIVAGAILGYVIWHDVPSLPMFVGAAVIIASGLYIAMHGHDAPKEIEKKVPAEELITIIVAGVASPLEGEVAET